MSDTKPLRNTEVIRLVAGREVGQRLRAKSFYIATGLLVIIVLGMGIANRFVGDSGPSKLDIAVVGTQSDEVTTALQQAATAADREATVSYYGDADSARTALDDEQVNVAVIPAESQVAFRSDVNDETFAVVQQAWAVIETQQNLGDAGLSQAQITQALTITPLQAVTTDGEDSVSGLAVLTGTLAAILLFISLQTFGNYVLTGVVEEKATAVVEVLLVRASADQLLAGKVLGIGLAALAQFALAVAAGLVSLAIADVDVPSEIWGMVPMTLVWFLLGFAFYSTLFALAGSLVSRQEDAQSAAAPINYALVAAYVLVFLFGYAPESTASTVMSLIPPMTPLLMPMRMAAGAASIVEVVAALVLMLAAIYLVWKLAGRIYEQVLLRRGSRITWKDAGSLARRHT
jgi:ABC-2 type transport system permease protein